MLDLPVEPVSRLAFVRSSTSGVCLSFCLGCSFDSNDMEFYYTESNIAIDWESSTYYLRYLSGREQEVDVHSSVMNSRSPNSSNSAVDRLEDCLQSFINWENLDQKEMFQCKRCKQLQPADKKLDIWKLPPCLVRTSSASRAAAEFLRLGFPHQTLSTIEQSLGEIVSTRPISHSIVLSIQIPRTTFDCSGRKTTLLVIRRVGHSIATVQRQSVGH